MRSRIFSACIGLAILSAMSPASAAPGASVIIRASGDRGWTLDCTFERPEKSSLRKTAGRGRRLQTIAARDVTAGRCDYAAAADGPLQLRFVDESDPDNCPFDRLDEHCIGRFAEGAKGYFEF